MNLDAHHLASPRLVPPPASVSSALGSLSPPIRLPRTLCSSCCTNTPISTCAHSISVQGGPLKQPGRIPLDALDHRRRGWCLCTLSSSEHDQRLCRTLALCLGLTGRVGWRQGMRAVVDLGAGHGGDTVRL